MSSIDRWAEMVKERDKEIERLQGELKEARDELYARGKQYSQKCTRMEQLEFDNYRYRKALESVRDCPSRIRSCRYCRERAREALEEQSDE